jgi:hypothetical protein
LANPLSLASSQVGKVALTAVDHVAVKRFSDAEQLYERALSSLPNGTPEQLANAIIKRVARELGAAGAVSGAVAAAPGVGTSVSLASGAADIGVAFGRMASMILAVGIAFGADLGDSENRRHHVYGVLSGSGSQLTEGERRAGDLKRQLGKQALGRKDGTPALGNMVTSKVGTKILSRAVAGKAASLLPLGIGAGVGAVGNRSLVFSVGRAAVRHFTGSDISRFTPSGSSDGKPAKGYFVPAALLPASERKVDQFKRIVRNRRS